MATLEELQKGLDERSINPNKLTSKQRRIIDELIDRGDLKGPKMGELAMQRDLVTNRLARDDEFRKDPIAASGKPGQATYELVGDLTGSIAPYVYNRQQIFGAAKSGNLWQRGPGPLLQKASVIADRLPGRFKFLGGALKLLARASDVPTKVLQSPLGRTELYSVLGGTAGAGAGAITYDVLNETAGVKIASAIADDLSEVKQSEVDRDILTNAAVAMKNAFMWNAGAAALSPFVFGPMAKGLSKLFGTVGPDQKKLAEYARDKGLPIPLLSAMKDEALEGRPAALADLGKKYFRFLGVFPFVSRVGKDALQGAEQEAGKMYLNNLAAYAPIVKASVLSDALYKQATKTYASNVDLYTQAYNKFDSLVAATGNPALIKLTKTQQAAKEFLEQNKNLFPEFSRFVDGFGDLDTKTLEKVLTKSGDPINTFMKAMLAIGDARITPSQYKGVMTMLGRAIEGSEYQTLKNQMFIMREAMETDFNTFGGNLTKGALLADEGIKATYDTILKNNGQGLADDYINSTISAGEKLKDQLTTANTIFSSVQGFYQRAPIIKSIRSLDRNAFTAQSLEGIYGTQAMFPDQLFGAIEKNVLGGQSADAIKQFKIMIGAEGASELGIKATKGGQALFKAATAKYMFNNFLTAFESVNSPQARSIFRTMTAGPEVRAGTKYLQDSMNTLTRAEKAALPDFDIRKIKLNNGTYDLTDIRFSPTDFAKFDIDKFMRNIGAPSGADELGRAKLAEMLGRDGARELFNFSGYMKAISDVPITDTSQFLQRRLTLGGSITGGLFIGSGFAASPLAPLVMILLAKRAGQILTDPVALRAMNDALLPEETLKLLRGEKLGRGTPRALLPGRDYYSGRSINTIVNALSGNGITGKIGTVTDSAFKLGLTRKREGFARLLNYLNEEDKDIPFVDPKNIDEERIRDALQGLSYRIPEPIYDEKNLPKHTYDTLFAQNFSGSSGNVEEDNNLVAMINRSVTNQVEAAVDQEERDKEADAVSITDDLQLENPIPTNVTPPTNTGQVSSQEVASLYPFDSTSIAAARRRETDGQR